MTAAFANYFARDVDDTGIPLVDGAPPMAPAEPAEADAPAYAPPRLRPCAILAVVWYCWFAGLVGAAYIYVLRYPLEAAEYRHWQAIPIGWAAALLLWAITLIVRRCARRERS